MATMVAHHLKIPSVALCTRNHKTMFQASLTVEQRVSNVKHVFGFNKKYKSQLARLLTGKHIILVDDLYTTGSTLKSLAAILTPYKPSKITALVACRVP